MIKKWKSVLMAAGILAAAAFSVFRGSIGSPSGDVLPMLELQENSTASSEEQAQEAIEDAETAGFTDRQKQELEELLQSCLEEQLSEKLETAVAGAVKSNLDAMMEDGRLPASVAKYQEVQSTLVNINTADAAELVRLNGIGEAKARAILQYREEHGAFSSVEELANISGISTGTVEKLRDQVTL